MPSLKPRILLLSPWDHETLEFPQFVLTPDSNDPSIQAILCIWQPDARLLSTPLPKLWYYSEPLSSSIYQQDLWQACLQLPEQARATHQHPLEAFCVPHITHVGTAAPARPSQADRQQKAIAIVSNSGHRWPFRRSRIVQKRNTYCLSCHTDLYGKSASWAKYRHRNLGRAKQPQNYCGEIPGRWSAARKVEVMGQYKAAICMENNLEPHYFTEKFVDAAKAACIPIYQPHPSVAESVLNGAKWIDPNDFSSADACLRFAVNADPAPYLQHNEAWLKSTAVVRTEKMAVYEQLGHLLAEQIHA